jgi:hypothetical protein
MSATKYPSGKPVKLLTDFQGFPDGRLVIFEIWRQRKNHPDEKVTEVNGVTRMGKAIGEWPPQLVECKEPLPLEKQLIGTVAGEEYFFIAKIDDQKARSSNWLLTYRLDIYTEFEDGKPVDGVEFTITFSDGNKRNGIFKNGHAVFDDAPSGKFIIELAGYDFSF